MNNTLRKSFSLRRSSPNIGGGNPPIGTPHLQKVETAPIVDTQEKITITTQFEVSGGWWSGMEKTMFGQRRYTERLADVETNRKCSYTHKRVAS